MVLDQHLDIRNLVDASAKRKCAGSTGLNYIVAIATCRQQCLFPFQLSTTSTTVVSSLYDNRYIGNPEIKFILH